MTIRRLTPVLVAAAALIAPAAAPAATLSATGVGPLRLGMTRTAAVATGWIGHRSPGCELESPRPIGYRFVRPSAPSGLHGSAIFRQGRLRNLSFTGGARTVAGVGIGTTTTRMVNRYRALGFKATAAFVSTFGGTFVTVRRQSGGQIYGAFATGARISTLAVPRVEVCE